MARLTIDNIKQIVKPAYDDTVEMIKKVNAKAVHTNRAALDKLSESDDGNLLYNGDIIGSGGGISDVSAEEGNAISIKSDGIYAEDLSAKVANLDIRSTISQQGKFFNAYGTNPNIAVTTSTNLISLLTIRTTNMEVSNEFIKLERGKSWKIIANVYKQSGSGSAVIIKDSNGKEIGSKGFISDDAYTGIPLVYDTDILSEDLYIGLYISTDIHVSSLVSCISISENTGTYTLDPVEYAQKHAVNVSTFGISSTKTITVNAPVVFDSTSGGIELSSNGYAKLKKDITYIFSASIYNNSKTAIQTGIRVYDVTNNVDIGFLGVDGHTMGTTSYKPSEDIEVSIRMGSDVTVYVDYTFFTVQEVKDPVVIEHETIKEISNPLTTSEISQETPIGTVIEYFGTVAPDYYLACNGSIVKIADYPKLFEKIGNEFGGDGINTFGIPDYRENLENITPVLTSNTSPSPYVASASTEYSGLQAYKAFDNNIDTGWSMATGTTVGWLKLDFGTATEIGAIGITARNLSATLTGTPRDFIIEGSNDDSVFVELKVVKDAINWSVGESRTFVLNKVYSYRYIRISVSKNNGGDRTVIGEVKLYKFSADFSKCIKYENTHYAVNQYGGFQIDTLWEGSISVNNTTVSLNYDYTDYDYLYFIVGYNNTYATYPILVSSIKTGVSYFGMEVTSIASIDTTCRILFENTTSFKLTNSAGNVAVTNVLGFKGSIPTFIEGGAL